MILLLFKLNIKLKFIFVFYVAWKLFQINRVLIIIFVFATSFVKAKTISPNSAKYYEGKWITVCGEVKGIYHNETGKGSPTNLNFGSEYPNQTFVALIWGDDLTKFNFDMKAQKIFGWRPKFNL